MVFSPNKYRNLTRRIIKAERDGFWSDWTPEQQDAYRSGDWKLFSLSRGYSAAEIEEFQEWLDMKDLGESQGHKPFVIIFDLAKEATRKNLLKDTRGEILLSSHIPENIHRKENTLCHGQEL